MGLDDQPDPPQWIFKVAAGLLALFAGLAIAIFVVAAPERQTEATAAAPISDRPTLLVFETETCGWCRRFRENVAPVYERSHLEGRAPLKYVHVSAQRTSGYRLNGHVSATPTFVLVDRSGREVSRLRGLPGGGTFLKEVEAMLARLPAG
jgi:thioredoxin-related protein